MNNIKKSIDQKNYYLLHANLKTGLDYNQLKFGVNGRANKA